MRNSTERLAAELLVASIQEASRREDTALFDALMHNRLAATDKSVTYTGPSAMGGGTRQIRIYSYADKVKARIEACYDLAEAFFEEGRRRQDPERCLSNHPSCGPECPDRRHR